MAKKCADSNIQNTHSVYLHLPTESRIIISIMIWICSFLFGEWKLMNAFECEWHIFGLPYICLIVFVCLVHCVSLQFFPFLSLVLNLLRVRLFKKFRPLQTKIPKPRLHINEIKSEPSWIPPGNSDAVVKLSI